MISLLFFPYFHGFVLYFFESLHITLFFHRHLAGKQAYVYSKFMNFSALNAFSNDIVLGESSPLTTVFPIFKPEQTGKPRFHQAHALQNQQLYTVSVYLSINASTGEWGSPRVVSLMKYLDLLQGL